MKNCEIFLSLFVRGLFYLSIDKEPAVIVDTLKQIIFSNKAESADNSAAMCLFARDKRLGVFEYANL